MTIPDGNYEFDAFQAVEPLGASKIVALIVPDDFDTSPLITAAERITRGLSREDSPTNYFMNLLEQVVARLAAKDGGTDRAGATGGKLQWAYAVLDYVIVK